MKRGVTLVAALVTALWLAGPASAATVDVDISGSAFDPQTLTVEVGTTVRWTNQDPLAHTVTSDTSAFTGSGSLAAGDSFQHTFDAVGDFPYHCSFHGAPGVGMTGTIHVVGPEFPASDPVYGPKLLQQLFVEAAWNGSHYLVAWVEGSSTGLLHSVFVGRVTPEGEVLEPGGIEIYRGSITNVNPVVSSNGSNFLVAWQVGGFSDPDTDVLARVVGADGLPEGAVLELSEEPAAPASPVNQGTPQIASDNTDYLVVWQESRTSVDLYGRRVSGGGALMETDPFPIAATASFEAAPDLAWSGSSYLVVWEQFVLTQFDVNSQLLMADGTPIGGTAFISNPAADQRAPTVAWNGTDFLTAWSDSRNAGTGSSVDVYGAHVTSTGTVVDVAGIPIASGAGSQDDVSLAPAGTEAHLASWTHNSLTGGSTQDIHAALVGAAAGEDFVITDAAGHQNRPALATDDTDHLVLWQDSGGVGFDVRATRVEGGDTLLDPGGFPVPQSANSQASPAIAFSGNDYLTAWVDQRESDTDLYAGGLSPSGVVLDGTGIPLATEDGSAQLPAVTWTGSTYLVAWVDGRDGQIAVFARSVDADGDPGDEKPIAGATSYAPALASSGSSTLIVWESYGSDVDIYGAYLEPDGDLIGSAFPIAEAAVREEQPAVSWTGSEFLVVWVHDTSGARDIYGARLPESGPVSEVPNPLVISDASGSQAEPAVASGGSSLVVWKDSRSSTPDIYGARVPEVGDPLDSDGVPLAGTDAQEQAPAVAWDGTEYQLAYERGDVTVQRRDVSATGVAGAAEQIAGFAIEPAVVAGGSERVAVLYRRQANEPEWGGAWRGFVRFLDDPPSISIEDVTVGESETTASVDVSLSTPYHSTVEVDYVLAGQTASSPGDFEPADDTLAFSPGETLQTIVVELNDDTIDEPNETLAIQLSDPSNATIADAQGIVTITDDDEPPPPPSPSPPPPSPGGSVLPAITISNAKVKEGNRGTKAMTFLVTLSAPSAQAVTVQFKTVKGTARPKSDFLARAGTLTIAPGQTQLKLVVKVKGDRRKERLEKFKVLLLNTVGATLLDAEGVGTIRDND